MLLLGTTAAGLSTALVLGHATNNTMATPQVDLAAATIGIGGQGDPTAANIPRKLSGNVVPDEFDYIPVFYPAGLDIDNSVAAGVPELRQTIADNRVEGGPQFLLIVGYSEGTIVAEEVRRDLDPNDPNSPAPSDLLFVMIASPNVPNGGIFARFPNLTIPFFVTSNGVAEPSPYDTTYVTNEYDPYADFPAYFNLLSLANTLLAVHYVHPDAYYDSIDFEDPDTTVVLVESVTNSAGGTDTYVFVPDDTLPLLDPVRQVATVTGTTFLIEPFVSAVEPVLRLLVDMGYTDRENLNPQVPTTFSLITPPDRVIATVVAMPGAIAEGANNFVEGITSIPGSMPARNPGPTIDATREPEAQKYDWAAVKDTRPSTPSFDKITPLTERPSSRWEAEGSALGNATEDGHKFTRPGSVTSPKRGNSLRKPDGAISRLPGGNKNRPASRSNPGRSDDPSPARSTHKANKRRA